ncbi:MAG: hypothetical protein RLZZ386_396 [Planctomycetota bacterium]
MFGRGVGRRVGTRRVRRDRAVVDDAAAARALLFHHAIGGLRAEKHAGQIDVDHRLPFLVGQFFKQNPRRIGAGVVEQHVDAAVGVTGFAEQRID